MLTTRRRGRPPHKLTDAQVAALRRAYAAGVRPLKTLAFRFNISTGYARELGEHLKRRVAPPPI